MVKGIGIDMVDVETIRRYLKADSAFVRRTFTSAEREAAGKARDAAEFYAARFAAKEAVFKALAHLTADKAFDLRIVETLNRDDGCPYVNITAPMQAVIKEAGVSALHISLTTENNYAAAFVVACG